MIQKQHKMMKNKTNKTADNRNKDDWGFGGEGYYTAKLRKIQRQFDESARQDDDTEGNSRRIFAGIRVWVNGETKPSAQELKGILRRNGGGWAHREQDVSLYCSYDS